VPLSLSGLTTSLLGRGTAPSADPSPVGRGTPTPYPPRRLRRLDPRAYGARSPPAFPVSPPDLGVLAETLLLTPYLPLRILVCAWSGNSDVTVVMGGSRNFRKGDRSLLLRSPSLLSLPLPFSPLRSPPAPLLPSPPFSPSLLSSPPLPLRTRAPLIQIGGLGERCKLPQRGPERSPGRKRNRCTLKLWESHGATENAGVKNAAPDCRGGKRGSGKRCTRLQGWKTRGYVGVTSMESHNSRYLTLLQVGYSVN